MSEYAENPVYGARQYEILVAQKADPRIEVQHLDDACWVLRFHTTGGQADIQVFGTPAVAPQLAVEETLVRAARHAMLDDERAAVFELARQPLEVTSEEYWQEVAHLARRSAQGPRRGGTHRVWDRAEVADWRKYLYVEPRTPHPMLHGVQRCLDVLRHTAHAEEYPKHVGGYHSLMKLFHFVSDAASWAMAADVAEQAAGSILYRPNARDCLTSEQKLPYPCALRRLQHFEDISFTMGTDAVGFTIGNRDYVLQIGDDDEKYYRLASVVANEPLPQLPGGHFELETDSEAELLAYLGERMKQASRLRPNGRLGELDRAIRARVGRALGVRLGKMIGCGSYGCVYEVPKSRMAVKLTTDRREAETWMWAIEERARGEQLAGLPYVHAVYELELPAELQQQLVHLYAVVRERVEPFVLESGSLWAFDYVLTSYAQGNVDPDGVSWVDRLGGWQLLRTLDHMREAGRAASDTCLDNLGRRIEAYEGLPPGIVLVDPSESGDPSAPPRPMQRLEFNP